jgi:phosphatidylinositol alpha-1,6-mannosyltransferase
VRTLWIAGTFHPQTGGIPVYVDRLTDALTSDCAVGLVTDARDRPPSSPHITHVPVAHLNRPATSEQWAWAADGVREAVERFEPDVVHFASAGEAVYRSAAHDGRIAAVATVHGNDLTAPWQRTPGRDAASAILAGLNACDHVFAVSAHTARLAADRRVRAPLEIVTAGCDLDLFRPLPGTSAETRRRYRLPVDRPLVLTVGRLAPRKGHLGVLAALELLELPAHWAVVGTGPTRPALVDAIDAHRMRDRVTLLGSVSKHELPLLYNACDVFVLTPATRSVGNHVDSEGFGLVYLEAAACGAAVIASDGAGCREAVVDGCTGLLVPPGDPATLAEALGRVLRDRSLAESMGRAGSAFVHASGGWARLAGETFDVYRAVVANRHPTPAPV